LGTSLLQQRTTISNALLRKLTLYKKPTNQQLTLGYKTIA
jgi:hypothetical protein